jgi:hypothetical protein
MPNDHYLPRFYLRGFCSEADAEFLWVYQKEREPFRSNIANLACETDYESVTLEDGTKDSEMYGGPLQILDSEAAPIFLKLSNHELLTKTEREVFAVFIAATIARVPAFRRDIYEKELLTQLIKHGLRQVAASDVKMKQAIADFEKETGRVIPEEISVEELRQYMLEGGGVVPNPDASLDAVPESVESAPFIFRMNWTFVKATDEIKFITTDNPVIKHGSHSIDNPEVEITFPISKDLAFCATWKGDHKQVYAQAKNIFVRKLNSQTITVARRFVYGTGRSDVLQSLVNKRLGTNYHKSLDITRKRIQQNAARVFSEEEF